MEHPLGSSNQRIDEIFEPLFLVAYKGEENILKYARKLDEEWRYREEASVEAEILENMLKCESTVENSLLLTKTIAEAFNSRREEKEKWRRAFRSLPRELWETGEIPIKWFSKKE